MTEARLCVVCAARGRQPQHYEIAQACEPCRVWLGHLPGEIVNLWARLADTDTIIDQRTYEITVPLIGPLRDGQSRPQLPTGQWRHNDPIAASLPTGANGARVNGDIVTGSRDAPIPVNLDLIDLSLGVHGDHLTDQGRMWWEDQTGHISVAQELDLLVREWADNRGERLPAPTVPVLAGWLTDRMGWACEHHHGVDHAAGQLAKLRGALRGVLGDVEPRPEHMGAPCPGCDLLTLIRQPGEDKVECANDDCRRVLTAEEYLRWSGLVISARRTQD